MRTKTRGITTWLLCGIPHNNQVKKDLNIYLIVVGNDKPPQLSVTEIVKSIKGRTSRRIQAEFTELSKKYWGQHFWSIGYAAFSAGDITDEMIKEYVKNHQDKDFGEFTVSK